MEQIMSLSDQHEPGLAITLGKSYANVYDLVDGQLLGVESCRLPAERQDVFRFVGQHILDSRDRGATWSIVGFPCPVDNAHQRYGPSRAHGPFFSDEPSGRPFFTDLAAAGDDIGQLLVDEPEFTVRCFNDAALAGYGSLEYALAQRTDYSSVLAVIVGTGNGAYQIRRQPESCRPSVVSAELGMLATSVSVFSEPKPTAWPRSYLMEDVVAAPGIQQITQLPPEKLPADHPHWREVAMILLQQVLYVHVTSQRLDAVVFSGGVGSGAADKYMPHLHRLMSDVSDEIRRKLQYQTGCAEASVPPAPDLMAIPPEMSSQLEALGALGVWNSHFQLEMTGAATAADGIFSPFSTQEACDIAAGLRTKAQFRLVQTQLTGHMRDIT